jgi:predicted DNA-binding transcriptional regulator YafY
MPRNEQLIRQHKLLQLLERTRAGQTIEELRDEVAEELGLSSLHIKTVKRDLAALLAAGFDIQQQHQGQRGKVWRLGPKTRQAYRIQASATELIALSLGRDLLYPLAGTPFWHAIESFWNKLKDELPSSVWEHYNDYRQVLYVRGLPAKSYERQHGILSALHRAIHERRVVEAVYQPPGKDAQTRKIEPYAVVFYQGSLYIVAAAQEVPTGEERIRHLKLDRFLKAVPLDAFFKRPANFDLEQHLGSGIGIFSGGKARDFKIRISARGARWVLEDPWHAEQKVERQPDGGVLLTVSAHHELEIIPRVLALGSEAELVSPASARQSMAAIVKQLAERYAKE